MYIPKIDPEILKTSEEIANRKAKEKRATELKHWLSDKIVDIIALLISIIALFRTF